MNQLRSTRVSMTCISKSVHGEVKVHMHPYQAAPKKIPDFKHIYIKLRSCFKYVCSNILIMFHFRCISETSKWITMKSWWFTHLTVSNYLHKGNAWFPLGDTAWHVLHLRSKPHVHPDKATTMGPTIYAWSPLFLDLSPPPTVLLFLGICRVPLLRKCHQHQPLFWLGPLLHHFPPYRAATISPTNMSKSDLLWMSEWDQIISVKFHLVTHKKIRFSFTEF
jgi:hypothetical protein